MTDESRAEATPPDTQALGRMLMDAFAAGWSKADVSTVMQIFADEAVFIETPYSDPRRGWDAIQQYWLDVPYHQSEIQVSTGEIYTAGPWFSTEFKAVFRRRRTGEWVEARGAIFCETEAGKVSEMRMYWHRKAG